MAHPAENMERELAEPEQGGHDATRRYETRQPKSRAKLDGFQSFQLRAARARVGRPLAFN